MAIFNLPLFIGVDLEEKLGHQTLIHFLFLYHIIRPKRMSGEVSGQFLLFDLLLPLFGTDLARLTSDH